MNLKVEPAYKMIPKEVTPADLEPLARKLMEETMEVLEAVQHYIWEDTTSKNLAHIGEELADVATMVGTCFTAIKNMDKCPSEDFVQACMAWVAWKNEARGYHNDETTV